MSQEEFAAHRAGIMVQLARADKLTPRERDQIRIAIQRHRREGLSTEEAITSWAGTPGKDICDRLVAALDAPDRELDDAQAHELEELVYERLPNWP